MHTPPIMPQAQRMALRALSNDLEQLETRIGRIEAATILLIQALCDGLTRRGAADHR